MVFERLVAEALRGAVILGFALAAMPLLRRSSAAARRLVLALALGAVLVVPVVSSVAPGWRVSPPVTQELLRGIAIAEPPVEGDATVAPVLDAGDGPRAAKRSAIVARVDAGVIIASVWALGAALLIVRLAGGLGKMRAIVGRAGSSDAWSAAIARAERVLGLRAVVRMTDELDGPAVAGVLAPIVLVPHASEAWSDDRRYAVLLHELAHVRRYDSMVQVAAQLACALHWFDPLAWLVARRLRIEREHAADDVVIGAGVRPSSYAQDLVAIALAGTADRRAPTGALAMAERSQLSARVLAILSAARSRAPLGGQRVCLLAIAAAAVVVTLACARPETNKTNAGARGPDVAPKAAPPAAVDASTIDQRLQAIADEELDRVVSDWQAPAGVIVVLDPATGEVLANAGRDHGARANVAVRSTFPTGSTLKAFTLSAALEEGVISPTDRIDCEHGERKYPGGGVLRDASSNGTLSVPEMVAVSSNIGFSKVFDRLGGSRLERWLRAFHFGEAPNIPGASAGWVPENIEDRSEHGAEVAAGAVATASPLQVAAAYGALANGGAYVAPTLSRATGAIRREQLVKPETARTVVAILEQVVSSERGTGKLARVAGTRVAGKTGTAGVQELPDGTELVYASFVGFFPSTAPRFVILVGVETTREDGYGPTVAAPVFARVATRALGG